MNTATDFHRADPEADRPTLGDLLRAVEALRRGELNAPESEFEGLAMKVVRLAEDLEHMTGWVDGAEVYDTPPTSARDTELHSALAAANRRGALDPEMWGAYVAFMEASRG